MEVETTILKDLILVKPKVFPDDRGFFLETFSADKYKNSGINIIPAQSNHSRSSKGVLRGLHFQTNPGQAKLMYCPRGKIWDVAVDVRLNSPTYGKYYGVELSDENHWQLFVPIGFAHGFQVLSDVADVTYIVSDPYNPQTESGIAYNDPAINIAWPLHNAIVSDRDKTNALLKDFDWTSTVWQKK